MGREVRKTLNPQQMSVLKSLRKGNLGFSKHSRYRMTKDEWKIVRDYKSAKIETEPININGSRVLVIGDLHEPFCLEGYREHCIYVYNKYNCDSVVFIGDVIDNHYSSYHETDPDGLGGGQELDFAIDKIAFWVESFPVATVLIGNHDRIIARKAFSSGIPKKWIRDYNEVLDAPYWNFVESIDIGDVTYQHGEGGTARTRMKKDLRSTVQGHLHTQAYIEWAAGANFRIFGMQVGCGIDKDSYAMAYGKNFPKPFISCAVVINGQPIIEPMDL